MRKIVCYCVLLLAVIAGCGKATSPGNESKINGTVLDPDGNRVADTKILVNFNIDCDYPIGFKNGLLKLQNICSDLDSIDDPPWLETKLYKNYPNPFTNATSVNFCLGTTCSISIWIEDMYGDDIKNFLNNEIREHGFYVIIWNGKNNDNSNFQNGLYKMLLSAEDEYYCDTLFVFKDYNDFIYDDIAPLCLSNDAGQFTIYSQDLSLYYVGDYFDPEGCNPGDFSVTPYIDIWAFHQDYEAVHVDSILVESGHDINITLTFK
ncbi:MAG: hypothetical protein J7M10_01355 [Candidatus Cloacimonetes bacterium]|nr:hypothetical protein [Candidatus Cloacimonadota bacterium]